MRSFILSLIVSVLPLAAWSGGSSVRGGGDLCENQIKIIRDDLSSWIQKGGPRGLQFPAGITLEKYSTEMLAQISKAKVRCIGPGDKDFPVEVYGTPKVCKFEISSLFGSSTITCDRSAFSEMSETNQYVLIHHEYAGLAGVERPSKDDSIYDVSNQISAFLVDQVVKRLSVKSPASAGTQPFWRRLEGREAASTARALQDAVAATDFEDCNVRLLSDGLSATAVTCDGGTYYKYSFEFVATDFSRISFSNMDVGGFACRGQKYYYDFALFVGNGGKSFLNIVDNNSVYHEKKEQGLHLRLDMKFDLDSTETKIAKVTITKSKIIDVNNGTVGNPKWGKAQVTIRSLVCNGSKH